MRPRTLLLLGLVGATGCGQNPPPPAVDTSATPAAAATAESAPPAPARPEPVLLPVTVGYERDPAQHVIPARPAAGELGGELFTPAVTLTGRELAFRAPAAAGKPERAVVLTLPAGVDKLVVRPNDPAGADVPELELPADAGAAKAGVLLNGYALTLELGPVTGSTRPGKVYLSFDDRVKNFLAGTFTATVERPVGERPGAADAPFLEGSVTRAPGVVGAVQVGYLSVGADGAVVTDRVTGHAEAPGPGRTLAMRADSGAPPRAAGYTRAAPGGDRYEFTHLPPGRYLVYARPDAGGGPTAWTHVDLAAGGRLDAPLALDPAAQGTVTVKVPAGVTDPVTLVPADPRPGAAWDDGVVASVFSYKESAKDGAATFKAVAPGTYRVAAGNKTATVTVAAGKPATVEVGK